MCSNVSKFLKCSVPCITWKWRTNDVQRIVGINIPVHFRPALIPHGIIDVLCYQRCDLEKDLESHWDRGSYYSSISLFINAMNKLWTLIYEPYTAVAYGSDSKEKKKKNNNNKTKSMHMAFKLMSHHKHYSLTTLIAEWNYIWMPTESK